MVLKESLERRSTKMLVIGTVSPAACDADHTSSSLSYCVMLRNAFSGPSMRQGDDDAPASAKVVRQRRRRGYDDDDDDDDDDECYWGPWKKDGG